MSVDAAVALRRAEFAQRLQRLRASRGPAQAALAAQHPALVVGLALAGGALLGRTFGVKRLLAPTTLLAGLVEDQLVKVLLGGTRRLWDRYLRDPDAPESNRPDGAAARDPN